MLSPRQETAGQNGRGINGYLLLRRFSMHTKLRNIAGYRMMWRYPLMNLTRTKCAYGNFTTA